MTGLDPKQLRNYIVEPALEAIGLNSQSRMRLVIGTGLVESGLRFVDQVDRAAKPGPAYGLFQMERATHDDIWRNFLSGRHDLRGRLQGLMIQGMDPCTQMHGNHYYAAAMCGVFYLRIPAALPHATNLDGMARYWKKYYNTHLGAGREDDFLEKAAGILQL